MSYAVDLAHWPWPWGWLWRNCAGNAVEQALWIAAAVIITAIVWPPARRRIHRFVDAKLAVHRAHQIQHEVWVARQVASLHRAVTGTDPEPHPHGHDLSTFTHREERTMPTDTGLRKGLRPFDPDKHARFRTASQYGFDLAAPKYPIDKSQGITEWGMLGNGPDPALSVNGGQPVGDCGVAAVPAHAGMLAAAMTGLDAAANTMTADQTVTLYFTYEAAQAGVDWRPPPAGHPWSQADIATAAQLDQGVDLGDYLLWLFHQGLVEGFVAIDLAHLDAALDTFDVIVVGGNCNPQMDQQFSAGRPFDIGPGDMPDPQEGHAVLYLRALSPTGPYGWCTWSKDWPSTKAWRDGFPQQAFAIVTHQEAEAKGFQDQYAALVADLAAMGGTTPPPQQRPPAPAPPGPTPPEPPPAPQTPPPPPLPPPGPAPAPPRPKPPVDPDSLIDQIEAVATRAIQRILELERRIAAASRGLFVAAEGDGALPALPKWTDPGSVALFLTAVFGNIIAVWTLAAPWDPRWSAAAQAAIPIASFLIAGIALTVNVYLHRKTTMMAWAHAQQRAMLREAIEAGARPTAFGAGGMHVGGEASPGGYR